MRRSRENHLIEEEEGKNLGQGGKERECWNARTSWPVTHASRNAHTVISENRISQFQARALMSERLCATTVSTVVLFLTGCAEIDLARKAGADQFDMEKATHECYRSDYGKGGYAPNRIQWEQCMEGKGWHRSPA